MLKQKRQLFELLFMASDLFVVTLAWFIAYALRFMLPWLTELLPPEKGIPPFEEYLKMVLFIWPIWAFVFRRFGLYRPMRGVRRIKEVWLLVNANALSILLFIAVTYLFREKSVPYSRMVFVYFGLVATVLTLAQRSVLRAALREVRRRGYNLRYLLVIGAGKVAGDIATRVRMHRELGIQLLGCLSRDGVERKGPRGVPIVGSYAHLREILRTRDIDQVLVALPLEDNQCLPELMEALKDSLVDVKIVPDVYQFVSLGGTIEEFEGLPVIGLQNSPLEGINLVAKRVFDLAVGSVCLLVLALPMAIIAVLLKLTSSGPVLYRQKRVSFDGSSFTIVKFRTMYTDAERNGPQWSTHGDKRVTPLGRFLRTWSLDELPQIFNVLRGDMSIVGPRPERPVFIEEFRKHIPRYMLRHKVPAGMTGWAQVHGWRGDTSIDKRIEFDLFYIENWSLVLDLKILWMTLLHGWRDRSAY